MKHMSTALVSAVVMAATLSLAGCGKKDAPDEPPKPEVMEPRKAPGPETTPPAPVQPPPGDVKVAGAGSGFPECDSYLRTYERYMACDKVPQESKDLARPQMDALRKTYLGEDDAGARAGYEACERAHGRTPLRAPDGPR